MPKCTTKGELELLELLLLLKCVNFLISESLRRPTNDDDLLTERLKERHGKEVDRRRG